MQIRKSYKFRVKRSSKNKKIHQKITACGKIWNHALALQRRYYQLTGGYVSLGRMKNHFKNLRNRAKRCEASQRRFWYLPISNSQTIQDILERLDKSFQDFFKYQKTKRGIKKGLPRFKASKHFRSMLYKTSGYKILEKGIVQFDKKYKLKFIEHRKVEGDIKTILIKRDAQNRLWIVFSVIEEMDIPKKEIKSIPQDKTAGFDFGLKTFLVDHTGKAYTNPEFFKNALDQIRPLSKAVSKKQKRSKNRTRAKRKLSKAHEYIANKRRDHHFKLAHALCDQYDILVFEDLNMSAMKKLWGRKISDLAFSEFLSILEYVCEKRGKIFCQIPRFEPTTVICSQCFHRESMALSDRTFSCTGCGLEIDRDENAAINIKRAGMSALGIEPIRPTLVAG